MSGFNLVSTAWIPVIRASGRRDRIRPAHLTDEIAIDPIIDIDFARADFRCATTEFIIGLLIVAYPPRDNWAAAWKQPPSPAVLERAFASLEAVFAFGAEGPLPYQDFDDFAAKPSPVEALLIEAPGAVTVRKNATLFVKSGRMEVFCLSAAAIALLTLQTMAPTGGRGHRTSLRGGGPLTTLVIPNAPITLWHRLWANVYSDEDAAPTADLPRIFPWLAPTRLSGKQGRTTTPEDVDWRQAFFGMPRRIRLNIEQNLHRLPCNLTGELEDFIVRSYRTLPHGIDYDAWGGMHPLTPHYRTKASDPVRNPVHGSPGRIGYRQWVAMLYGDKDGLREPARCVSLFVHERKDDLPPNQRSFRLSAAGYAMDNMKALAFVEAETPDLTGAEAHEPVAQKAKDFVAAASNVAGALGKAVRTAVYGKFTADIPGEPTLILTARDRFWATTSDAFFAVLNDISSLPAEGFVGEQATALGQRWHGVLERAALSIFDDIAPMQDALSSDLKRVVDGRRSLVLTLLGYGPRGVELFSNLQVPVPETKAKRSQLHGPRDRSSATMGANRPPVVG
jgi:CRISPR system Cascade subunit CasA